MEEKKDGFYPSEEKIVVDGEEYIRGEDTTL